MAAAATAYEALTIAEDDPRSGDALVLFDEMTAFGQRTYPEDAEAGIVPTTPADFARGLFVVARFGEVAVGIGGLLPLGDVDGLPAMEVKRMYVRDHARGQHVGEQVLRWLEIMARTRGAKKLVLQCGPRQPTALRMYERCGYSGRNAYGKHQDHPLSIFFEKRL